MYKEASQLKLRFNTSKGVLSVEQLWDLNLNQLSLLAKSLSEDLQKSTPSDDLSFLEESSEDSDTDSVLKLSFNIVKDIYLTKQSKIKLDQSASEVKEHNQKILSLIKSKEDEDLKSLSVEELKSLLK